MRVSQKFYQLIEIIREVKVVHAKFIKKLKNTSYYELRIKAGNEYRVIIFAIDNPDFAKSTKALCLNGFLKKSTKDYDKAIKEADKILYKYFKNDDL